MNEMQTLDLTAVEAMPTEELYNALKAQVSITAEHIHRLAIIWRELERRGEDLSRLRTGLAQYLPAVATGRVVPEAVVKLAGNATALRALSTLVPDEQRAILNRGHVIVATGYAADGSIKTEERALVALAPHEAARVFDSVSGTVLPPEAQKVRKPRARSGERKRRVIVEMSDIQHDAIRSAAERRNLSMAAYLLSLARDDR